MADDRFDLYRAENLGLELDDLATRAALWRVALEDSNGQRDAALADGEAAARTIGSLTRDISSLQTANTRLTGERDTARTEREAARRELAEVKATWTPPKPTPPVDPPPPTGKRVMPIGGVEADDLERLIGERLGMYRRYDGDSVDATKLKAFIAKDSGGSGPRMRAYSAKGAPTALTDSILDLIPKDGQTTVMIFQNEVERPDKNTDRAKYKADAKVWIDKVRAWAKARGRTDVLPGVGHMGWHDIDPDPATSTALWWPDVEFGGDLPVVLELHPYDKGKNTLRSLYKPSLDLWKSKGGKLWSIGETGSLGRGDTQEAAWINQGIIDAHADGALYFAFFDSDIGGTGDWTNTTPAVIAAIAKNAPAYSG